MENNKTIPWWRNNLFTDIPLPVPVLGQIWSTLASPTENSWMLHPLNKVSLCYFSPDRTIPSLNSDLIERSDSRLPAVACFCMCGASVHPTEGHQSNKPGQGRRWSRPDRASSMLEAVQGRDTSVRGTISKGRFVQGAQHPRILGRGHIGWGHINPASYSTYRNIFTVNNAGLALFDHRHFSSVCWRVRTSIAGAYKNQVKFKTLLKIKAQ